MLLVEAMDLAVLVLDGASEGSTLPMGFCFLVLDLSGGAGSDCGRAFLLWLLGALVPVGESFVMLLLVWSRG